MAHSGLPEQESREYLPEGQSCLKQAASFRPVASRERLSIKPKSSSDTLSSESNIILLSRRTLRLLSLLSHFSHVQLLATPRTVACQAPLSMGFFRHEYWSGLPSYSRGSSRPMDQTSISYGFFTTSATWEAHVFLQMKSLLSMSRRCSKSGGILSQDFSCVVTLVSFAPTSFTLQYYLN